MRGVARGAHQERAFHHLPAPRRNHTTGSALAANVAHSLTAIDMDVRTTDALGEVRLKPPFVDSLAATCGKV